MKTTIKTTEFCVRLENYFSPYGERTELIAWQLKNFLESLGNRKPTVIFRPESNFVYRGKELPKMRFVVQYYGHMENWGCYVTTDSSLDSLTPGARKFMMEMFSVEIAEIVPSILDELVNKTKQKAREVSETCVKERINEASKELSKVYAV